MFKKNYSCQRVDKRRRTGHEAKYEAKNAVVDPFSCIIGLGAISYTDYLGARKAIEAQIESDIRIIVSSQANQLRSVQQTLTGGLRSVPQLTCFQNLVNAAEAGAAPEELTLLGKEASAKAAELVKEFVMIYSMAIVDTKRKVLAHSVAKNIGAYYGDRQYFKALD